MLALVVASVLCGEPVPLPEKVFGAAQVVEFTLSYEGTTKREAKGRIIFPPEAKGPQPELKHLLLGSKCVAIARKRKQLKVLAYFDANGRQLVGIEQDTGHDTGLDPAYPALVAAVLEAKGWRDERMRAVGAEQLWLKQKKALASDNPYLRRLAAAFLGSHGGADVVDAAWGAPGTPEREKNEAKAEVQRSKLCG